jgi:Amt family ammonium transporter
VSPELGGVGIAGYNMANQVVSQLWGVGTAVVWSGVASYVLFKLIDATMGLRVPEEQEREGLDTTAHGERAYSV